MEKKEFRERVLKLQEEIKKNQFEWKNVFRIQTLNEENTEIIVMIGDKLASKELFKSKEQAEKYIAKKPWELIASLIYCIVENSIKNLNKNEEK